MLSRDPQPEASTSDAPAPAARLPALLREVFGHDGFRPHQREVCESVCRGENSLVVMPTGAGKSLCYQLPGLARGGSTLVVSPLIALMDDQVQKLTSVGISAAAIHSGKSRDESRTACVEYAAGRLRFLFIAPERLGLPRFAEFLTRHRPTLIAIDEAHCISHWGHDFRPDYRLLSKRLPQLMPCPVVALTATATARVQDDIIEQLGVHPVRRHVFGFRRTNLAIECSQQSTGQRAALIERLLTDPEQRPAIVYAGTRKDAEQLAQSLGALHARAYHAGLDASERERIATRFLYGETDVIVATIAFGMGIDKPNVRCVVHAALPSSVEGYYQEIGRAGRDGLPSRAVLLHSFADVRTHVWFLERDYPPLEDLQQAFAALGSTPVTREQIRGSVELAEDELNKALDKLVVHGGATLSNATPWAESQSFVRGSAQFVSEYLAQRDHKRAQLAAMTNYTEAGRCRMLQLVQHFGDQEDAGTPCGQCDICRPQGALASRPSRITDADAQLLWRILDALRLRDNQAQGKLFRDHFERNVERKAFHELLHQLERLRYVETSEDAFEKDGASITFQRVAITRAGRDVELAQLRQIQISRAVSVGPAKATKRRKSESAGKAGHAEHLLTENSKLVQRLKEWRKAMAADKQTPAYTIMNDRALYAIAAELPRSQEALLSLHGIGKTFVEKYGNTVLALVVDYS